MKNLTIGLLTVALLAGCGVSKQVVAEKDAALDACLKDLTTCQEAATARAARAENDLGACSVGRQQCQGELEKTRQDLTAAEEEAKALKQREDDLRARLQNELRDKTVEIENLRGRLSVRVVDKILFDSGSADILPKGKAVLDKVAAGLKGTSKMVRVEGHTDDVPIGSSLKEKYFSNWELSAARAASVVRYFQYGHDMAPERLEAVGLSLYRPVVTNDSEENRHWNRRVEIVLTAAR
jgi:chemotaxis protein MotB